MKEMLCNVSLRSAKLRGGATAVEAVQSITVVQKYLSSAARAGVWGLAPIKERGGGCARQDTEDSLPKVTSWLSVLEWAETIAAPAVTAGSLQRSKKHRVQYNPVVLKILSWSLKDEKGTST